MRTIGMGGVIGFDHAAFGAAAQAQGLPADVLMSLLPDAEAGMLEGLSEHKDKEKDADA